MSTPTPRTFDVFVYGTLLFSEVTTSLGVVSIDESGSELSDVRRTDVVLPGYERFAVSLRDSANFPAIIPGDGAVHGHLLTRVSEGSLRRLDEFEGVADGYYSREVVTVMAATGEHKAFAYVCGAPLRSFLGGAWDPEAFRDRDLLWYLEHVVRS